MEHLGFDESNHGRFPEFFVGYLSNNPADIKPKVIPKQRSGDISCLYSDNYLFFSLSEEQGELLGPKFGIVVAIAETISAFLQRGKSLERVIIDGVLSSTQLEELDRISYPTKIANLIHESNADRRYLAVNEADKRANALFRMHSRKLKVPEDISQHEIKCNVQLKYARLIDRIKESRS